MRLSQEHVLAVRQAAERIALLSHSSTGYGVRSSVQARNMLMGLARQNMLNEAEFALAFAATSANPACVAQVRQFVTQVIVNRAWLLAS